MNLDNWINIAREVGAVDETGRESSSSEKSREAIEILLGKDNIRKAVRYYISGAPGSELMRGVLWQLHPRSAMEECYEIFVGSRSLDEIRTAIELLRVVADKRVLKWLPEFLSFDDEMVQTWAIGIVDQLVFSGGCDREDVREVLELAQCHSNLAVRENAAAIDTRLKQNEEIDRIVKQYFELKNA